MGDALVSLLITAIILAVIVGVVWAILRMIPWPAGPLRQIVWIIFWAIVAILVVLKILVPLLAMV